MDIKRWQRTEDRIWEIRTEVCKERKVRTLQMRLCSGAEVSIYGQARRTHFSLTSVSKRAWANRGRAWLEGAQGKANSGQTGPVKASRHAGALLTAAPRWHLRSSALPERPVTPTDIVRASMQSSFFECLWGTYRTYVWELQWSQEATTTTFYFFVYVSE